MIGEHAEADRAPRSEQINYTTGQAWCTTQSTEALTKFLEDLCYLPDGQEVMTDVPFAPTIVAPRHFCFLECFRSSHRTIARPFYDLDLNRRSSHTIVMEETFPVAVKGWPMAPFPRESSVY